MMKQTQRLTAALTDCGLSSIGDFDLEAIALRIDRAVIRFKVFAELESRRRAKDEREWVRSVGRYAGELARLLSKPPKVAMAFMEEEFDFAVAEQRLAPKRWDAFEKFLRAKGLATYHGYDGERLRRDVPVEGMCLSDLIALELSEAQEREVREEFDRSPDHSPRNSVAATDCAADWAGGPGSIEPILRCLAQAADQVMTKPRLGLPSAPKKLGRSPRHRLIVCLAAVFAELAGEDARITRIDREGHKGGPFYDFICALAARWEFRPPSAEAIAAALRSV
jgi:hypothetical protein